MPLGDLLTLLKNDNQKSISVKALINASNQIAAGLMYLEEKKVIHYDLALRIIQKFNFLFNF